MNTELKRMSTWPSVMVIDELLVSHGGNPPNEVLQQAGFSRDSVDRFLEQRAAIAARCSGSRVRGRCANS